MLISIFLILFIAAWGIYTARRLKRSVHMLQQNAYRNERLIRWMKNNGKRAFPVQDSIPLLSIIVFLLLGESIALLAGVVIYALLLFTWPKEQTKKQLVFTPRVKRLFTTIGVLYTVILVLSLVTGLHEERSFLFTFVPLILASIVCYVMTILANMVNWPIEMQINQHYFNDAEKRITSMPNLEVIGVTGSYGKTSTKHILETVLSADFNVLMTPESYNTKMGVTKTIRTKLKPYHELFIAEMGAKQEKDIEEICELVHHKYGMVTAIGEQHLETFKTLDTIKKTKFEMVETLPPEGTAFLNKDDENIMSYEQKNKCRTIYYGIDAEDLHYQAGDISFSAKGSSFKVYKYDGSSIDIQTKLLGRHNIYNILAAIAMASEKGMELETIARAVRHVQPVEHRLELKKPQGNITIVDDSFNSNPTGASMALEVLGSMPEQKILVTPGMIELGEKEYELNKELAKQAADECDYIILVGKQQTKPLQDGLEEKDFPAERLYVASDLQDALSRMREWAQVPSVVLLENDLPDTFNE
ncbi:UDP-N-acetylmuramoyl-tripeptide--D-alanyl-D-alanine ligase [Salsuginibacillus kocurii]|uniref:UDP-N-acetylmuramoyl-tripeptide--D-alanyl-D- alanine ligase n=1 Tax=Salsuginibacillus kocurii TaxID=427078 RepID=UPI00036C4980|nr:UDP-N-acetylmuramoyl-tripeptide--D-alanyl-D-alanine ligase [Salsuginibacillus kocurii]